MFFREDQNQLVGINGRDGSLMHDTELIWSEGDLEVSNNGVFFVSKERILSQNIYGKKGD